MINIPPVVHVGYMKTGTTTLQIHLFAKHPRIASLAKPNFTPFGHELRNTLIGPDPDQAQLASLRSRWSEIASQIAAENKIAVFSYEGLSIVPAHHQKRISVPDRINAVFGEARILITIRNQFDFLKSLYVYRTRPGSYRSLDTFLRDTLSADSLNLDFYDFAAAYRDRFGKNNVGIFPIEQLRDDSDAYFQRLADFLSLDTASLTANLKGRAENTRRSARALTFAALRSMVPIPSLSQYAPKGAIALIERFLLKGRPPEIDLPPHWRETIEKRFAAGNSRLATEYSIPLRGYPTN